MGAVALFPGSHGCQQGLQEAMNMRAGLHGPCQGAASFPEAKMPVRSFHVLWINGRYGTCTPNMTCHPLPTMKYFDGRGRQAYVIDRHYGATDDRHNGASLKR